MCLFYMSAYHEANLDAQNSSVKNKELPSNYLISCNVFRALRRLRIMVGTDFIDHGCSKFIDSHCSLRAAENIGISFYYKSHIIVFK